MSQGTYEYDPEDENLGSIAPPPPGQQGQQPTKTNAEWAAERRERSEAKKAQEAAEALKRENAFLRAGIDPNGDEENLATYFVNGYKGELTPEAIRAAAEKIGLYESVALPGQQQQVAQENQQQLEAAGRIANIAGSADAAPDQQTQQIKALQDSLNAGGIEAMTETLGAMGVPRATL